MSERKTPLFAALYDHAAGHPAAFHTPGHKGHMPQLAPLSDIALDLTELPDTGSLYDGGDVIEQAERLAAAAFGARDTLFSAGGCTLCIQAMLLLGAGAGGRVLMARTAHRSAVHAAVLLGLEPVWLWPAQDAHGVLPPDAGEAERALAADPGIRAVYITSPDYAGNLADIPAFAAVCRRHGVPLLVDNAHGSHLGAFGLHPLALGADLTADSAHKTLPVLTGGAMLHIGNTPKAAGITRPAAKAAMALFGSTSPAFPVLASLDLARSWWEEEGPSAFRRVAETTDNLRRLAARQGIEAYAGRTLRDPSRLTLDFSADGRDAAAAAEWFRRQGCEPEYADNRYLVFILTPGNTEEDFARLERALEALPQAKLPAPGRPPFPLFAPDARPQAVMPPREAVLCAAEEIPMAAAAGRIAARTVCPCPPGVPAIVPGERFAPALAAALAACGHRSAAVCTVPCRSKITCQKPADTV